MGGRVGRLGGQGSATPAGRTKAELQPPPPLPPAELFVTLCLGRREGSTPHPLPSPTPAPGEFGSLPPLPSALPEPGGAHPLWLPARPPGTPRPLAPCLRAPTKTSAPPPPLAFPLWCPLSRLPHLAPPSLEAPQLSRLPRPPPPPRPPRSSGRSLLGAEPAPLPRPRPLHLLRAGRAERAPPPGGGEGAGGGGRVAEGGAGSGGSGYSRAPGGRRRSGRRRRRRAAGRRRGRQRYVGPGEMRRAPAPPPPARPPPPPRSPAPGPGPHCVRREAARPLACGGRRGGAGSRAGAGAGLWLRGQGAGDPGSRERRPPGAGYGQFGDGGRCRREGGRERGWDAQTIPTGDWKRF